ncbi:hypothetical protein D9M71_219050 [compost metagenome]
MKGEGIDVVQRQRRDKDFAAFLEVRAHQGTALQHVGHQVAVGQHRALGHSGGTAGVLQHGHIAAVRVGFLDRLALALAQRIVELDGVGQAVGRDHFLHVLDDTVDQYALDRWKDVAHFGDEDVLDACLGHDLFRQVRHVRQANQGLGTRVVELVFHFPCGVQRVGVDHDQPGANGTENDDGILQQVGHLHGDAIARLQVRMLLQVSGKGARQLVQFAIVQCFAKAAKSWLVGEALARLFQYRLNIRKLIRIDFGGNPGWVLILPKIFDHGSPLLQR